jgi:hypothetical protein
MELANVDNDELALAHKDLNSSVMRGGLVPSVSYYVFLSLWHTVVNLRHVETEAGTVVATPR